MSHGLTSPRHPGRAAHPVRIFWGVMAYSLFPAIGANRTSPLLKFAICLFALCVTQSATAVKQAELIPPANDMRQHSVPLKAFEQLHAGMTLVEVEKLLGKHGEHQFTYTSDNGDVWRAVGYVVAESPKYASLTFHLFFKGHKLVSIVHSDEMWNALKALRPTLEQSKDPIARSKLSVQAALNLTPSGKDIAGSMPTLKKFILQEEKNLRNRSIDPGLTAIVLLHNLNNGEERKEFAHHSYMNRQFMEKYDGGKIDTGMTEKQVEELFGRPLWTSGRGNAEWVSVYGPSDTKSVGAVVSWLACSPVAIVYRGQTVTNILSNWFCDYEWRDKAWPNLKSQ
jgi:hypothetical protein